MTKIKSFKGIFKVYAFIFALCLIVLLFIILGSNIKKLSEYNLIIISVDTLVPEHMGIYGYKKNTTPSIDNWAKNAHVFTNVRVSTPITYPSFVSLFTGLSSFDSNIINNQSPLLDTGKNSLAKILKKNGYKTSAFITSTVLSPELTNLDMGFDVYEEMDKNVLKNEQFIDKAIQWIKQNAERRIFFWTHLIYPHWPYQPPYKYRCMFNESKCYAIDTKGYDLLEKERKNMEEWGPLCRTSNLPQDKIDEQLTLYDGEIYYTDQIFNKLLKTVNGLKRKSIVVFYADHGEGFDHSYYFYHGGVLYDSSIKIPLIIYHPDDPKKEIINRQIENQDLFNTILQLLHLPIEKSAPYSYSFADVFKGFPSSKTQRLYTYSQNYSRTQFSVYDGVFKYIYSKNLKCSLNTEKEELYDITKDPLEKTNIILQNRDIANKLKQILFKHLDNSYIEYKSSSLMKNKQQLDKLKSIGY